MTVYYRDGSVLVDSQVIRTPEATYPIRELHSVWLERGAHHTDKVVAVLALRLLVGFAGALLLAALGALAVDLRHPTGGVLPVWLVYGYVFASPVVLGVLIRSAERTHDGGSRDMRLCARFRGTTVVLFSTTNATRFGQVHRAVARVLERDDHPTTHL